MKKYFIVTSCITFALTLCVGIFAQQKVNPESVRKNPSQANVEFTDMSLIKGVEVNTENSITKAPIMRTIEKNVTKTRTVVLNENFSDYTAGGKIADQAQAMGRDYWTTWGDDPGGDEDGDVFDFEGNNVANFSYGADQILKLGGKAAGIWELSLKIYIPAGKEGYFNVLAGFDGGGDETYWALQVYFNESGESPGVGALYAGGYKVPFNFNHNAWIDVKFVIDLDNDIAEYYINDELEFDWEYSNGSGGLNPKVIYGMDIYPPTEDIADFYMDDIVFSLVQMGTEFHREDFSAYTVGEKIAEQALDLGIGYWTTWSGDLGEEEDGEVILFENNKVGSFSYGVDQILLLGEKTEGIWELSLKIYVPTGKEGYFNILAGDDGGDEETYWAFDVYFNEDGSSPGNGKVYASDEEPVTFTFNHNAWTNVKARIDLDDDNVMFYINNNLIHQWVYTSGPWGTCPKVIYGLDIFPPTENIAQFYIDDIELSKVLGVSGVGTFNIATGTGTGNGWTWENNVLTILDDSDVTVTGRTDDETNSNRILIAEGATTHLTLEDASILMEMREGEPYLHPLFLDYDATLTLTIKGENIIRAGNYTTGISVSEGRKIIIDGDGSLSATGGWQCSGIGGGLWDWGPCGTIVINGGTIYAKGANSSWLGTSGAGIGSGAAYAIGDITINGGSIIASPGNETAKGIGTGGVGDAGNFKITGNPIIFTNSVSDMNPENKTGGILVARNATYWYGNNNFTLEYNTTVPATNLLTIEEGKSITIPAGKTLINNGTIVNYSQITINGTLINNGAILNVKSGTVNGTIEGNAPVATTPADNNINLSNENPVQVGDGWLYANNVYAVLDGADVVVTGDNANYRRLEVASNAIVDIMLNDAKIKSLTGVITYQSPLMINAGAKVNLTIEGENLLTAARTKAGLQVPVGASLIIDGTGSLTAKGGEYGGAGIGGAFCENCGKITINGGIITGYNDFVGSYHSGAGIGGGGAGIVFFFFEGMGGLGGNVTINGGVVNAYTAESSGAPGIGGGGSSVYGGTLTMEYDGVAFASSLETYNGTQTDISGVVNGILFDGLDGILYGAVEITVDIEIPEYYKLTIPQGATLTIPKGITLNVKGTVVNNGTIIKCGTIIGTIGNNQPVPCNTEAYTVTFNVFNGVTLVPVLDAVIIFDGEELDGYHVDVEEGTYEFTVFHPDYGVYSGSKFVNESMTIDVPLYLLGISGMALDNVVLYPNPFKDEITISNPSLVKSVVITNAAGQKVQTTAFDGKKISTKGLAGGIYFVILESHNGEKVFNKMIKK